MLDPSQPSVVLAPMEGVTDAPMRAVLSARGGFTHCVSEFVRVSHSVLSPGVIRRRVPELSEGARTPAGLPVQVQLLGGDPGRVAESAANAVAAGATAIDLNFGCPAPTVNKHDGGATLLKDPPRIRAIVSAVRAAVSADIPVSAKLRLGWDRTDTIFETSAMAAEGGANWITIHARTRMQGYAPPVEWGLIGKVRERLGLPVVANGDIGSLSAFRRCRDETGCIHFMLGRGAVADPGLARHVAAELDIGITSPLEGEVGCEATGRGAGNTPHWPTLLRELLTHTPPCGGTPQGALKRLKQWLRLASNYATFAHFDAVKLTASVEELLAVVEVDGRPFNALAGAPLPTAHPPIGSGIRWQAG